MTVKTLCDELGWTVLTEGDLSREITGCYCGDLLSWVMSKAQDGDCWLTVMGNINAVAVSTQTSITDVQEALQKLKDLDIESLNKAITDLTAVIEPLANFTKRFGG